MYDAFRLIGEYFLPLWLILSNFGSFGSRILVPGKNNKLPGSRADKLTHFLSPCPRVGNLSFSMFCHFYPGIQFSSDIFFLEIFTSVVPLKNPIINICLTSLSSLAICISEPLVMLGLLANL